MNDQKKLVKTSKKLSLILRHEPQVIGIEMDENGWVNVEELIRKFSEKFFPINRSLVDEVVATNNKKRFSFDDSGHKIRANQGHTVAVDVQLEESEPPALLYHGTVDRFLPMIFESGLLKMKRQHVHLSVDIETAQKVGARRGKPVLLIIKAKEAHAAGIQFFLSANGVWLTDHVPPVYLERL
ncbi:MAG: RNA 2'-phosphotransferase [Bacteroidota bacterium]